MKVKLFFVYEDYEDELIVEGSIDDIRKIAHEEKERRNPIDAYSLVLEEDDD